MFGLFKKKSAEDKLREEYQKLMSRAFELSKTDRTASDQLYAEADQLMSKIEELKLAVK